MNRYHSPDFRLEKYRSLLLLLKKIDEKIIRIGKTIIQSRHTTDDTESLERSLSNLQLTNGFAIRGTVVPTAIDGRLRKGVHLLHARNTRSSSCKYENGVCAR